MVNADTHSLSLRVIERRDVADAVVELLLMRLDGGILPSWTPGAHVNLLLQPGLSRQYSLCGDPHDRSRWRVGVLREAASRGGSVYVHDQVKMGDTLTVAGPNNHFPLVAAPRYIFIAGGIGITPIVPMVGSCLAGDAQWELHYGGRTRQSMAFRDELLTSFGARVHLYPEDEVGLLDLDVILGSPASNTLVYCCGPSALLDAVEQRCRQWPAGALRGERFAPKDTGDRAPDGDFEVELRQSGIVLTVQADQSILEAVRLVGVDVESSCEEGTCGTCKVAVCEGKVEHRDVLLTPEEQAAHDTMFICCSRALSSRLVLDL